MPKTYVSLDLETTGLEPGSDAIIEVGALRFDDSQVIETFSSFVNPGRRIPQFITELTGITDEDVKFAPGIHLVSSQLKEFVGRDVVIGHNVGFDLAFLRRHGVLQHNGSIDTFELAGILVPHAGRYSLESLVQTLGVHFESQTHRALDDAHLAHLLFVELMNRAAQLSPRTLQEIIQHAARIHWSPGRFFSDALYTRNRQGFTGGIGAQLAGRQGVPAVGPLFIDDAEYVELTPREEPIPLDLDALTLLFVQDGPIAETFGAYEYRDQQIEMLQSVGQAFNNGEHLFVEAGTGTGKSVAYLVPAIEWAVLNGQRVVISTNTINLQDQLANKDIPELAEALYDFRFQVLKGRSHYLCRQQFEGLRRRGPANADEMRVMAKVLMWLPNTLDGDGDGIFMPTAQEHAIWNDISAATDACDPERCRFFQGDRCFFYRARDKAEGAHILIVNHALLLADIAAQNRVLPDYDLLIIDEAHHLERATTESLRYTVSWLDLNRILDDLLAQNRPFPSLLDQIIVAGESLPRKNSISLQSAVVRVRDAGERTQQYLDSLFSDLEIYLQEHTGRANRYGIRYRLTPRIREERTWEDIVLQWSQVAPHFEILVEALTVFQDAFEDPELEDKTDFQGIRVHLLGITRFLGTAHSQLKSFIDEPTATMIYWLESRSNRPMTLNAAPLHVGALIQEHLLSKKRSIIFTSATLRIEGSFEYMRDRLGVDHAQELAV
ncbi:MAG: exonuclease domain-containing protein, partial [Anaerolineae bacterium]|nr:exonuclease domain-containing protein [Anaerolineae bacterium]